MKARMFFILFVIVSTSLVLSACGAAPSGADNCGTAGVDYTESDGTVHCNKPAVATEAPAVDASPKLDVGNFPQTAQGFVDMVKVECSASKALDGCVTLTSDMVMPIYAEADDTTIVGWEILFERNGQDKFYEWTTLSNPFSFPQYGWMRDINIRTSCGLTVEETKQLGYVEKMAGATIPGLTAEVDVEGASFYYTQVDQLAELANQTAAQRCPSSLSSFK